MAESPPAAAAPPGTPPAAPAQPPRSKKMIIIILASLVALGGAGAGAYFFLGHKGAEEEPAVDSKGKPVKGAKAEKGKKAKDAEPKAPAVYVKLDPPFVVNFEAQGVMRFLQVTVEVLTRDPHVAEMIKANDPQIRNDLLLLFGAQQAPDLKTNEGKEKLRNDARDVVAKIVTAEGGEGKMVENVYFTSFVMQ